MVAHENPYTIFYVNYVPQKGTLYQNLLMASGVIEFFPPNPNFRIRMLFHISLYHTHKFASDYPHNIFANTLFTEDVVTTPPLQDSLVKKIVFTPKTSIVSSY